MKYVYRYIAFFCALFLISTLSIQAEAPTTLNYQAVLTNPDGDIVADGTYQVTFSIYSSQTGGQSLWTEVNQVAVINGVFSVVLGKNNPINLGFDTNYWLGLKIGTGNELLPRNEMTSSAYAQMAKMAEELSPNATGVVRSINSIEGSVTLEGGGGTTINTSGNTITISSSGGGAGGDLSGTYPNPTIGIGKVTTNKIADLAVTDAKIKDVAWTKITGAPGTAATNIDGLADGKADTTSVFLGLNSGNSDDGDNGNTAVGVGSLKSNTSGNFNTANGSKALFSNISGSLNTANGNMALYSNTSGDKNTANGDEALYSDTSGDNNTANGYGALYFNSTGSANTANGSNALSSNTSGDNNTANGSQALYSNETGFNNTANGSQALYSNVTGFNNTANGHQALYYNLTGYSNVAVGTSALCSNTTISNLVAVGDSALYNNGIEAEGPDATANTAVGSKALYSNTTGNSNTANGFRALYQNTIGIRNTAVGYMSLYSNQTGNGNTAIGFSALSGNQSGGLNTAIGNNAGVSNNSLSNTIAIGYLSSVDASNKVLIGNTSATSIGGQVAWTNYSDGRFKTNVNEDIPGLNFVTKLRPVTYHWDLNSLNNQIYGNKELSDYEGKNDIEKIKFSGFIAQEVQVTAKEVGYDFSGVDASGNVMGLRYTEFIPSIVKSIQEQQAIIESQRQEIQELRTLIMKIQSNVNGGVK